ncbi:MULTISPECIES: ATP-binding protein [Rhodomicrobium]|uniref:sensor histidine kinase n=1 Tax=Rhodomicrobium TaxID=1068 RepID=UPI001AECBF4F|nr:MULTISPECIES: ATP-binding protein [Rhodomicrobium]
MFAVLGAGLLLIGAGVLAYRISERAGLEALSTEAHHRLDLFAAAIGSIVNRYAHVPSTIPLNPDVVELMRHPEDQRLVKAVNDHLEQFNQLIGSIAIYVMTADGLTRASSNWNQPDSFVGEDLSFRPYFQSAQLGVPARYYAVGTTRGEPGYFVSYPIRDEGRVIGVSVIKIGLKQLLEQAWLPPETPAIIADGNGVVILSSVAAWRLTALAPLTQAQLDEIDRTRQYNRQPIGQFPVALGSIFSHSQVVDFPKGAAAAEARSFFAVSRQLAENGWRITVFSDMRPVYARAWNAVAFAATGAACFVLVLLFFDMWRRNLRQRLEAQAMLERANAELETKVAKRTQDLVEANQLLRSEVTERQRAETTLRAAQDELVQAAKLAVLGQLATGITHELTQPLGALRTLSENAVEFMRRGDSATLGKNLEIIGNLVDRMGAIIGPLKSFARVSPAFPQAVDVKLSIANAQFLLDQKLIQTHVKVHNYCERGGLTAWCDPVRLEQVLVNLMANAIDAMAECEERTLTLRAEAAGKSSLVISVADTGIGLPPAAREKIFEPFFTTKPPGEGLGLGLAISRDIIRDFGGSLSASSRREGGAEFIINLPTPPSGI